TSSLRSLDLSSVTCHLRQLDCLVFLVFRIWFFCVWNFLGTWWSELGASPPCRAGYCLPRMLRGRFRHAIACPTSLSCHLRQLDCLVFLVFRIWFFCVWIFLGTWWSELGASPTCRAGYCLPRLLRGRFRHAIACSTSLSCHLRQLDCLVVWCFVFGSFV